MDDLYHRAIKPLVGRGGPRDIVKIEVRDRDIDCWIVDLRTRQGKELRLSADSEDEARAMATQIEGWRQRPETVPAAPPILSSRGMAGLFWLAFLIAAIGLALDGALGYSLLSGWAYTRYFLPGFGVAVLVVVVLFATAGAPGFRHPFQWGVLPLCVFLTIVLTSAGKSVNARLGTPERIVIEGPIVFLDAESWDIQATQRTRIKADLVVMQVEDTESRRRYEIEVPAWVAEREGVRLGAIWRDRFQRGALGWLYREGTVWDERAFRPSVVRAP